MGQQIRLIVSDIDGCLGAAEAVPYDIEVLAAVADLNRRARRGEPVPAVTLCSGRPGGYVDAMMQVIAGFYPAIFENGAGLYFPDDYRFAWHPALPPGARRAVLEARELLEEGVIRPGLAELQLGKEMALTLIPRPGHSLEEVGRATHGALEGHGLPLTVEVSVTTVGIWLAGIDKGQGVTWLAEETGIPLAHMAGISDTREELCFLRLVGFSAAPANADAEVRAGVDYVSPYEDGRGLLDIIDRLLRQ